MNSEELEKSLRTEFESHLRNVLAEMRQELDGFQKKFQIEIEDHKTRLSDVFQEFSARLDTGNELDDAFKETVVEHLRLARDEGARITAEAITEAEEMEKKSAPPVSYNELRDAINEISSQNSQAEILKSLVNHAAQYVPRGAFFIVKNEHFVGWRVFGKEAEMDDKAVREIFLPLSESTVLGESVRSLATVESSYGTFDDDAGYLEKLDFGQPDRMYALPLIARGRGVAVLYADYGREGTSINIEAIETLMRVAGLTVELLAASRNSKNRAEDSAQMPETSRAEETSPADYSKPQSFTSVPAYEEQNSEDEKFEEPQAEQMPAQSYPDHQPETAQNEDFAYQARENNNSYGEQFENVEQFEKIENQTQAPVEENYYQPAVERTENYSEQNFTNNSEYQTETVNDLQYQPETDKYGESENTEKYDYSAPRYSESETLTETEEVRSPEYSESEQQPVGEDAPWNQPVETNGYSYNYAAEETSKDETSAYEKSTPQSDYHIPASSGYDFEPRRAEEPETASFEDEAQPTESQQMETPQFDVSKFQQNEVQPPVIENYTPAAQTSDSYGSYEPQIEAKEPAYAEPVETISQSVMSQPVKTRFSERNVDLPIDVAEDERRLHNDARRFARLLVSEIKLYNEQKVNDGRTSYDLYDRLREAIDRSREMYDKRVQPPVAAKFDYFHYELVNSLGEGDESRLGGNYPGAAV